MEEQMEAQEANWYFATDFEKVSAKPNVMEPTTIKGSQFRQPLLEFSGACAGCGETAYMKLVTQLFGPRMMVANATGCSSIWGASAPSTPYTINHEGKGPSWANSLFEDNAEYGYGMYLGVKQLRNRVKSLAEELVGLAPEADKAIVNDYLANMFNGDTTVATSEAFEGLVDKYVAEGKFTEVTSQLAELKDYFVKRSNWILGGDGWAYDIGYGGLDHVLASGEDINVLVFDTEVYSNTGGQASKATPVAAMAKFAAAGKRSKKKDLGMMAATYGNVYVAQVAIGADKNQVLKAIIEAEKHNGPSLIIAYAPCINHGIRKGMGKSVENEADAVKCGYWHLYRFNPELKAEGKNPFILDSKEPTESFREFIMGQNRYASIAKMFPEESEELFALAEQNAKERYEGYKALADR